jgi:hypothetical protein
MKNNKSNERENEQKGNKDGNLKEKKGKRLLVMKTRGNNKKK